MRRGWKNVIWNTGLDLPGGTYIERLAHRWRYAATLYQRYAAETRLVRYEDFCERKEETITSLAQRLGLPGRNDIADKVDEQYQPRGSNREASWEAFSERPTSTVQRTSVENRWKSWRTRLAGDARECVRGEYVAETRTGPRGLRKQAEKTKTALLKKPSQRSKDTRPCRKGYMEK